MPQSHIVVTGIDLETLFRLRPFALVEGSVYERLRRHPDIAFDADLAHASLVYDPRAAALLEAVHLEYWAIGQQHRVPMLTLTDTWRANQERLARSRFRDCAVNEDNVRFLTGLRARLGAEASPIFVGGQIGPRGDAYKPEEALDADAAARFHAPQVEALASAGVDFLQASTLPAVSEALGIAEAMSRTGLPYVVSFVIRRDGSVLDGTPLARAIACIDDRSPVPPTGYAVNCVHPETLAAALAGPSAGGSGRLLAFQANASARTPEELDGLPGLEADDPEALAGAIVRAARAHDIPFLGGCCGTDARHIACVAQQWLCAEAP